MGLIKKWITGSDGKKTLVYSETECKELSKAWQEYQARKLAFEICTTLIANAMSRCEFRTFRNWKEVNEKEKYIWNVRPNAHQNSSAFMHRLIKKLFYDNEVLIVETKLRGKTEPQLIIADSFAVTEYPEKLREYSEIGHAGESLKRKYKETEVIYLRLNEENVKPILDAMAKTLERIISIADKNYKWNNGKHWKVHIDQIQQGTENFTANFAKMIENQLKPFLESEAAVLPEFDGYQYGEVGGKTSGDSSEIRRMIDSIFNFTAQTLHIPPILLGGGEVSTGYAAGTEAALKSFLTFCIDPICDQLQEEINEKRYGYELWEKGNFLIVDSSTIIHVNLFEDATAIEKLIGSGYSPNEVRAAFGQPGIDADWAREHYITKNFAIAEKMLKEGGAE